MLERGSQIARRWARLRLAATFAASPAALSTGARAQTFASLAHFDGANGLIGLSLGAGLVIFAAGASLLLLAGRKNWSRREAELLAGAEHLRQEAERARAFLAADSQFVVVWGGARGEPEIEGDVTLVLDTPSPRRALDLAAWLPPEQAQALEVNVSRLRERGQGFC
jgi:hypothetical protein